MGWMDLLYPGVSKLGEGGLSWLPNDAQHTRAVRVELGETT